MNPVISDNIWSQSSLFNKAKLYLQQLQQHVPVDWQYSLWLSFCLEFLVRAALAHISPALIANKNNWKNIAYAIGRGRVDGLKTPMSITTREVIDRLSILVPEFSTEHSSYCLQLFSKRNSELHTGDSAFAASSSDYTSTPIATFYEVCDVLLRSMDKDLGDLFQNMDTIREQISARKEQVKQLLDAQIKEKKAFWNGLDSKSQQRLRASSAEWATPQRGHRVLCPSCGSHALVKGEFMEDAEDRLVDDVVEQRVLMLPSSFECIACELRLAGLSKLIFCGLGDPFIATTRYDIVDFFSQSIVDQVLMRESQFELDFNE